MAPSHSPAETYEAFMVPYRFRPWAVELLNRVELKPGTRLLDIACGTGIVARVAAERSEGTASVVGIDMNPAMIEVAGRTASEEHLEIAWQVGNAESLPFPDRSFDLVTIQQGLQFFPDKFAALSECLRVLSPGGVLAVGIWSSLEKQGLQLPYAEAIERVTGSASMHASYGTVTDVTLRELLASAGFGDISIEEVTIELGFDDPSTFVGLMVESTSAGVPTMHGRSDEERKALAEAVAREMAGAVALSTVDGRLVSVSTAFIALGTRPST